MIRYRDKSGPTLLILPLGEFPNCLPGPLCVKIYDNFGDVLGWATPTLHRLKFRVGITTVKIQDIKA